MQPMPFISFLRRAGAAGVLALGAAFAPAAPARTPPAAPPVSQFTLANGMKLIVKEDRRAPSVVHMVWYRAGAMDEPDGVSGVAHVLEHMMFKGTKEVGPGEFNRRVAAVGGRDNAFTGKDYTGLLPAGAAAQLPTMMALEADRMKNLVLTDEEFAREIEVVKEERRLRTDDQPRALVFEQLMATAYQAHPYRRPVIGWMPDLEAMQPEDARAWYRRWYAPNNAWLVVVGDVDHREVFREAEQTYGALPAGELPAAPHLPRAGAARPARLDGEGPRRAALSRHGLARARAARSRATTARPSRSTCSPPCSTATTAPA
jgi:zinc protease